MTDAGNIQDILTDQERLLMVAWMLPNEGELTDSQRKSAMDNFAAYLRRHRITAAHVGHQLGSPRATTIVELTKGTYRTGSDGHIRKLNMWVEQHHRSRLASVGDSFVTTKVAKEILAVARLASENKTLAMIMGPSGIGKTRCALQLYDKYVGSIYVRIVTGAQHPKGLGALLSGKLGVRNATRSPNDMIHPTQLERIVCELRHSNRLLIIDEASKLTDAALELLRDIHDECGVPMVLLATRDLHDRILANASPDHGQTYSRFDVIHHLTEGCDIYSGGKALFTQADIKKLYNEPPVRLADDGVRYLQDVANLLGWGSLRRCKMLLQNAVRRARKRMNVAADDKVTVTADDLEYVESILRRESTEQANTKERRRRAATIANG